MTTTAPKRGRGRPPKTVKPIEPALTDILPPAISTAPLPVVSELNPHNPASIERWPSKLPVEVALGHATTDEKVCKAYGLTPEEWRWLQRNPEFQEVCEQWREMIKTPADEFKMKAQLLADDNLKTAHRMIHDPDTPAPQKADLMKTIFRMAGYDNKNEGAAVGAAVGLSINLILGDK
jgi:hypothetical protein